MDDSKDVRPLLADIRDSQPQTPKAGPLELTLLFRFTILHIVGLVLVAAVSCQLAIVLKPELLRAREILLRVATLVLVFGMACYVGGVVIGRYTAIRGQWWAKIGSEPNP